MTKHTPKHPLSTTLGIRLGGCSPFAHYTGVTPSRTRPALPPQGPFLRNQLQVPFPQSEVKGAAGAREPRERDAKTQPKDGHMSHATATAPPRTTEQRVAALATANRIRSHRKELKQRLKYGRVTVAEILRDPSDLERSMKIFDLMMATPKIGRVRVNAILTVAKVSPSKTLGGLTERQRQEIIRLLSGRGVSPIALLRNVA